MSKSQSTPKLKDRILEVLEEGPKHISEIREAIPDKAASVPNCLTGLKKQGEVVKVDTGIYALPTEEDAPAEVKNPRGEAENTETINKMLNLYDKLLDAAAHSIENEDWNGIVEKIEAIKSLRWLGATVDQLMKRWYLVHRGYDSNTRQAQEDAKHRTSEREKQEIEQLPPDKRIKVIRSYDTTMQELIDRLPGKVDHEV